MNNETKKRVAEIFHKKLNQQILSIQFTPVGGGSINETYQIIVNGNQYFFVKINSASSFPALFQKEKNGLAFLRQQNIIGIPGIIGLEENDLYQILIIEWIQYGNKTEKFWKIFGEQLALLHHISNSQFGYHENNYMGALPQVNTSNEKWIDFFIHHRLKPQVESARNKKLLDPEHTNAFEKLYLKLTEYFDEEKPSLLHGDLWSGNFMCNENSEPVLIDPAVYFGHRSMDLAMTTLFGGFNNIFYQAYNFHFSFPANYTEQWDICNLYPLLIHLNLFGRSYLSQITTTLHKYT